RLGVPLHEPEGDGLPRHFAIVELRDTHVRNTHRRRNSRAADAPLHPRGCKGVHKRCHLELAKVLTNLAVVHVGSHLSLCAYTSAEVLRGSQNGSSPSPVVP